MNKLLIMVLLLAGCAVAPEVEWINTDPNAVLTSDEYDCENTVLARQSRIGICVACGFNDTVDECLHKKHGWTKITRY